MTPSQRDRVFSAAEHLCRAAMSKPNQKSFFLRAAINPFQGSQDSLREANNLRQKHEKMLKKTVPVSSVLHSTQLAANHKLWKTRFVWREDSFYSYYFKSTKKSKMMNNSTERSRFYSFSLVFCLVVPRFCARSQITTLQYDLDSSFSFCYVFVSCFVSYNS